MKVKKIDVNDCPDHLLQEIMDLSEQAIKLIFYENKSPRNPTIVFGAITSVLMSALADFPDRHTRDDVLEMVCRNVRHFWEEEDKKRKKK